MFLRRLSVLGALLFIVPVQFAAAQVLDKQQQLDSFDFWDNRDWNWYAEHIPFLDCPDTDIKTTYYYRWELLTKHLTYGSPNSGYTFTEFIDRPFWSGAYGAISCPAGHQLYETRWLRRPRIAKDYLQYWFRTPGAQPRNYSTWLADSAWAVYQVHPDQAFLVDLLPDLVSHYEAWEQRHYVPETGLFWQTGHDDGMEFNINSRQTQDILRGAPSYRPSFNAYMWADAKAIARIARLADEPGIAEQYEGKATALKTRMLELLWDDHRKFFFPVFKNDEHRDGFEIKALSKTYESGQFAGDVHGRELIGYVPWQFKMIESGQGYEVAWAKLMDRDGFFADFGPLTVERNDPMFLLQPSCCWWSGQSWPYATTQTLKALAHVVQQDLVERAADDKKVESTGESNGLPTAVDYLKLLQIYARSHRKDGRPYLAEALHPDTGSFAGHDAYNHSEHYFHSGFCDLVITGLVGLIPRDDDSLEVHPLAPAEWRYFALDDVPYRGHRVSILWDQQGDRYDFGPGLHVLVDGKSVGSRKTLGRLVIDDVVPLVANSNEHPPRSEKVAVNFAVNNDGTYYPRVSVSYIGANSSPAKLIDGNYWYHRDPPNRWTTVGSTSETDEVVLDLGVPRRVQLAKMYFLEDDSDILPPREFTLETWRGGRWEPLADQVRVPAVPTGRQPNIVRFPEQEIQRLRLVVTHAQGARSGLTELELWGEAALPVEAAEAPAGNLAFRSATQEGGFPQVSASYTSRFDQVAMANDGRTVFAPSPHNRWTSYESKSESDWLEIEFERASEFRRVELAIYDDRGGVQPPATYDIQFWDGRQWQDVHQIEKTPAEPIGSQWNQARFKPVTAKKVRVVFWHRGQARSGISEIMVWND